MTLEQLANLGEFISGLAVIGSVIYLAIQIRQNTQSVKSSTLATNTSNWSSMLVNLATEDRASTPEANTPRRSEQSNETCPNA